MNEGVGVVDEGEGVGGVVGDGMGSRNGETSLTSSRVSGLIRARCFGRGDLDLLERPKVLFVAAELGRERLVGGHTGKLLD